MVQEEPPAYCVAPATTSSQSTELGQDFKEKTSPTTYFSLVLLKSPDHKTEILLLWHK